MWAEIAPLLRAARRSTGLTQRELADRARMSQSSVAAVETLQSDPKFQTATRLLAAAGYRLYAAPTTRDDVASVASAIRDALRDGDRERALRLLIQMNDNLVAVHGLVRGVLVVAEPELIGIKVWDAAIAALVAYRLNQESIPLPRWVHDERRALRRSRTLKVGHYDLAPPRSEVPAEFLERGVLAWRDTFESV